MTKYHQKKFRKEAWALFQISSVKKQRDLKKQEIKEEYYTLNKKMIAIYRKIGVIHNNREINERYNKSNSFLQSCEIQNHFPKLETITDFIYSDL